MNRDLQRIWDDPERLKWWTLEKLYGGDIRDLPVEDAHEIMEQHSVHRTEQVRQAFGMEERLRQRARQDPAGFANMPSLLRYARKRPSHRPKGREPGLAEAWAEIARIRELWHRTFGKKYRSAAPTAIDIAAWRHAFTPDELVNYGKNRHH